MLKKRKIRNWLIAAVAIIILVPLTVKALSPSGASAPSFNPNDKVVAMNVAETVDTTGSLQAQPFADLGWNTSGVVDAVKVKAGDQVKAGDVITLRERTRKNQQVLDSIATIGGRGGVPAWLALDADALKGTVQALPKREDIQMPIDEQLIVELYSK